MRIKKHPILEVKERRSLNFFFNNQTISAMEGEPISSALIANGIHVLGRHHKDNAPHGIFCVNGQCSQCMVISDGKPVKSCMTLVKEGMKVYSCDKIPELSANNELPTFTATPEVETDVLIIGGGPSGISAAIELGSLGIKTLVVDDKNQLGGKLTLQTHSFFGAKDGCYAGVRGIEIANRLSQELTNHKSVEVVLNTTVVACFSDKKLGAIKNGKDYFLINPKAVLVSTGARERNVLFPGCDLVGVYGAGAFQTLVNRDLIRSAEKLFILGGGNVGLIGAYHALQAGIKVLGLAEGMSQCGGYKVHLDKILRLGVPVFTSHTVVRAEGHEGKLKKVVITEVDKNFKPVAGTEKTFDVDTLLVAVGLSPVNELYLDAKQFGIATYVAGDAREIAEASAAIFGGKIAGREIAKDLGKKVDIPKEWHELEKILQSRPGKCVSYQPDKFDNKRVYPLIRCIQEIPCDPCVTSCAKNHIKLEGSSIMDLPVYDPQDGDCSGCGLCVLVCPGLAISLLYPQHDPEKQVAKIMLPYELDPDQLHADLAVSCVDYDGNFVCIGKVLSVQQRKKIDKRSLVYLEVPYKNRFDVAGFRLEEQNAESYPISSSERSLDDKIIVCRCERITKAQIKEEIRRGVRDLNTLKATLRTGMGSCGGKTCTELILRICREENIKLEDVTTPTRRPLVAEVPLSSFAGIKDEK